MSLRSLSLVPLLVLAAPAAAGDRLLVAGPDGFVMQADTDDGVFGYFACLCSGPIRSMAADAEHLFTVDELGLVLRHDVHDGTLRGGFVPSIGQINALAAAGGALFAGTEEGFVVSLDGQTGAVLDTRPVPTSVHALLAHEGFLFAGGTDGAVYRAPLAGGDFGYFTCFCFSTIQAIVVEGADLVITDEFGITARSSLGTGELVTAFWVPPTNVMAVSDGRLLLYYDGGSIPLADAETGQSLPGGFQSPIAVEAMLVIEERPQPKQHPLRGNPRRPSNP
jgi:hypothetical protein